MFDTLTAAQELTEVGLKPEQAAAITHTVQRAVEHGNHVTSDQFKAGQAEMRAEMSRIEADLKSDMKLLKFGYGPVVVGLLVKLVFFP